MKVANLTVGLEVAIHHFRGYRGTVECRRGIVVDPAYWTRKWGRGETSVRRGRENNRNGLYGGVESGIPVAVERGRGNWVCELIAPNMILDTWAGWTEMLARVEGDRKIAEAKKKDESARLEDAAKTLNEVLGVFAYRRDEKVVLGVDAVEAVVAALLAAHKEATA